MLIGYLDNGSSGSDGETESRRAEIEEHDGELILIHST